SPRNGFRFRRDGAFNGFREQHNHFTALVKSAGYPEAEQAFALAAGEIIMLLKQRAGSGTVRPATVAGLHGGGRDREARYENQSESSSNRDGGFAYIP